MQILPLNLLTMMTMKIGWMTPKMMKINVKSVMSVPNLLKPKDA